MFHRFSSASPLASARGRRSDPRSLRSLAALTLAGVASLAVSPVAWSQGSTSPTSGTGMATGPAAGTIAGAGWSLKPGLILDGGFASGELPLATRGKGFGLGHTELLVDGAVDSYFSGRLAIAAHQHHGSTEFDVDEAWLDARGLPVGLQLRMGRFLPQVGYLSEQHPHADDFSDRPAMYRAFFGGHWSDTGLRLNWIAPTDRYWRVGLELLKGDRLGGVPTESKSVGAWTLSTKIGDDWGLEHSWQLGLAWLGNRQHPAAVAAETTAVDGEAGHGWEGEGALFTGRSMAVLDGVWKWAPGGNNRNRQLRLSGEFARIGRPYGATQAAGEASTLPGSDRAWYVSAVYRLAPQWETGVRYSRVDARMAMQAADDAGPGRWGETSVMVAWKPSHMSAIRLQYSHATMGGAFDDVGSALAGTARHAIMLQYVGSLGAHPAHSY